jgi:hypothetical protein
MTGRNDYDDPALRNSIAIAGALFIALGAIGFAVAPNLRFLWIVLIVFGVATIPRIIISAIHEYRATTRNDPTRKRTR